MALYLVQHGLCASKESDPQKQLTHQGRIDTERIAQVAKSYGINIAKIVHSGKKRAEETAEIYHKILSLQTALEIVPGISPLDNVRIFAETLLPDANLMVVGHLPFMQKLVSYLTTGSENIKIYQFQNSGIVCLDVPGESAGSYDWFIKWTINPTIS